MKTRANMPAHAILCICVLLTVGAALPAFPEDMMDATTTNITKIYNDAEYSSIEIKKKIKANAELEKLKTLEEKINYYYDLGANLEAQGRFDKAEICYKKVTRLCENIKVSPYIIKKSKKIKALAQKNKKKARAMLKTRQKLGSPSSEDEYAIIDKEGFDIIHRIEERLEKLENRKNISPGSDNEEE